MKTTYKGVTTEIPDNLFAPSVKTKSNPRKSYKFGSLSLYYDGRYYFPSDIKENTTREGKQFEIQAVYYDGKWRQDTVYITTQFKDFLLLFSN